MCTCLCLFRLQKMNWFWVYIVWAKKLAVMHILVITGLPFRNLVSRFYVTIKAKIWISEYRVCHFSYPVPLLKSGLPLAKSGKPFILQKLTAQNPVCRLPYPASCCYSNYFSKLQFSPKTLYNCSMAQNVMKIFK